MFGSLYFAQGYIGQVYPNYDINFDSASNSTYEAALSTYNWSHTVHPWFASRYLIVSVAIFATGSVSSITYDSVNLTKIRSDVNGIYTNELWGLVTPNTGTKTITVTLSTSLTSIASASSYYYVNQTSPIEANNGSNSTGNPASSTVTTVADRDLVVAALATQTASGVTDATTQNNRTNNTGALGSAYLSDRGIVTPAGSTGIQWNNITALQSWAISGVALRSIAAAALTTVTPRLRSLLGVGL